MNPRKPPLNANLVPPEETIVNDKIAPAVHASLASDRPRLDGNVRQDGPNPNEMLFIHSMFRAGSTYVASKLGSLRTSYTCYNESVHELTVLSENDPLLLITSTGRKTARLLRHPYGHQRYFARLFEAWPAWRNLLPARSVYETFFDQQVDAGLSAFFRSLQTSSRRQPVFSETRTHFRIRPLRQALGGFHAYLWRNARDQWWSFQVDPYFDAVLNLITSLPSAPSGIRRVRQVFAVPSLGTSEPFAACRDPGNAQLTSEESYALFYALWCLSFSYANTYADVLLSIDRLSTCNAYRRYVSAILAPACGRAPDFSDCAIPQHTYGPLERRFFQSVERRVRVLLSEADTSHSMASEGLRIRPLASSGRTHVPGSRGKIAADSEGPNALRLRYRKTKSQFTALARRNTEEVASLVHELAASRAKTDDLQNRLDETSRSAAELHIQLGVEREQLALHASAAALARETLHSLEGTHAEVLLQRDGIAAQLNQVRAELDEHRRTSEALGAQGAERLASVSDLLAEEIRHRERLEAMLCTLRTQRDEDKHISDNVQRYGLALEAHAAALSHTLHACELDRVRVLAELSLSQRENISLRMAAGKDSQRAHMLEEQCQEMEKKNGAYHTSLQAMWALIAQASGNSGLACPPSELAILDTARRKLAELCSSSHFWYLEAERYKADLTAVLDSRSWRVMRPVRWLSSSIRSMCSWAVTVVAQAFSTPCHAANFMLLSTARRVARHPWLVQRVSRLLTPFPLVRSRVRMYAVTQGILPLPSVPSPQGVPGEASQSSGVAAAFPHAASLPEPLYSTLGPRAAAAYRILARQRECRSSGAH